MRQFVFFFSSIVLQFVWAPHVLGGTWRTLQAPETVGFTRDDIEREFMGWVQRVGSKRHFIDAMSELNVRKVITVEKNGKGDFRTIHDAINSIPKKNYVPVLIRIGAGVFQEKIKITKDKAFLTLQGAGMQFTRITWHDTARSSGSTFESATVSIMAPNFVAKGISFVNSAPPPPPGAQGRQAVALQISGDRASFYNCGFYGAQDTLYDDKGRHYFKNCVIQGSIDFIFGDGLSLYQGCVLHAIHTPVGSLTAQSRNSPSDNTGFSFVNCTVTGSGMLYLGRAWGPYSRVVFIYTYMDNIIFPSGWNDWGQSSREKTVFYGQYKCFGPGANDKRRVRWSRELTATQAAPFQTLSFIDGESWVSS